MGDSSNGGYPHITDLSSIEPENFKFRNTAFLRDKTHHYDNPHNRTFQQQRADIWRVRNGDIRRVLEDFPTDRSLPEQCALWMHAVVGKHFFEDGNHRTAIATLRKLLKENGIDSGEWPTDRVKGVRKASHKVRGEIDAITLETLYKEDELYRLWLRFFEDVLPDDDCR